MAIRYRGQDDSYNPDEEDPLQQPQVMTVAPIDQPIDMTTAPTESTQPTTQGAPPDTSPYTPLDPPVQFLPGDTYPAPAPAPSQPPPSQPTYPNYDWGGQATNGLVLAGMPLGTEQTAKRAATAYLASGAANPGSPWVDSAVSYLNATYPQYGGAFHKIDDETLGIGNDEYIHSAPVGYGLASGTYDPNARGEFFWGAMSPSGGTSTGSTQPTGGVTPRASTSGSSRSSAIDPNLLAALSSFGQSYGGPQSGGIYGSDQLQQVGQDPLSQLLTGGLAALIGSGGRGVGHATPEERAAAMEDARMPYEAARKVQLNNARAALANRGLLSETQPGLGLEADALGRIEEMLAPAYTSAIDKNLLELRDQSNTEARTFLDAVNSGTQRQQMLSDIAIRSLEQNRLWNQFLAQFGLDRDKALYDIASGQNQQLILLLQQWLNATGQSANGFI